MTHADDSARAAMRANVSPRSARLLKLDAYATGQQYAGRPSFWDDSVPAQERAPCIVYPVVGSAIRSTADMVLGEGRWPEAVAKSEGAFDPRLELTEDEAERLQKLIASAADQCRLRAVMREALEAAMSCGTTVLVGCVKRGRLSLERHRGAHCNADRATDGTVKRLEIRYPYLEDYRDADGSWKARCVLYRRVVDADRDVTYKPAPASAHGTEPKWIEDPDRTVDHALGFCPVVWYRHDASCATVADQDGRAIHADVLDEVDQLNMALSLRHRAALYASDPQTIEIGVDEDHNPAPIGRQAKVVLGGGIDKVTGAPLAAWVDGAKTARTSARMRGVGVNWRYPNAASRVELMTLPGDALAAADDNARDLRSKIAEALGVVFVDPDNAKFSAELSGKALARLYDRQIRLADRIREDFGDGCLVPTIGMLLRIAVAKADGVYLAGLRESRATLERFLVDVDGATEWMLPDLDLSWGPYFELDANDAKAAVEYVSAARDAKLITLRTAVQELSDVFDIGNIDEYTEALEEEAEEAKAEAAEAMAKAQAAAPEQDETGEQGPTNGKPMPPKPGLAKAMPPMMAKAPS